MADITHLMAFANELKVVHLMTVEVAILQLAGASLAAEIAEAGSRAAPAQHAAGTATSLKTTGEQSMQSVFV